MDKPRFYIFDNFRLDTKQRILWRDNEMVVLPPKVYETLHALVRRKGEIVEREQLMREVWADTFVEEGNLSVNISFLRKTLGKDLIETIPRRGYRFTANTQLVPDGELATVEEVHAPVSTTSRQESDQVRTSWRNRPAPIVMVTVSLVALLFISAFYINNLRRRPAVNSLAVLPFRNVSGDQTTDYLSDGLSETLTNKLSQLRQLKVTAQSTASRYKGRQIDPQEAGRTLNVESLVLGRIAQRGDHLIINVELIDVRDGTQIWGEQYNREFSDIVAVQSEITREITDRLRLKLSDRDIEELAKHYTDDPQAYQAYLKGRFFMVKWTPESVRKAVEYFNEAISRDPKFTLAYAGLSYCYYAANFLEPWPAGFRKARRYAQKVVELDSTLAQGHTALGVIALWLDNDGATAEAEFKRAIELDPNDGPAHLWYGFLLMTQKRFDESIAEGRRADQIQPLSNLDGLGVYQFYARQYEEALKTLQTAVEFQPNGWFVHLYLGRVYEMHGDLPAAIAELERTTHMEGATPEVWSALGYAYALAGKKNEALKMISQLKEQAKRVYVPAYNLAIVYAGLGDTHQAFAYLEKEYDEGAYYLCLYRVDPELDSLRGDPRFAALLYRLNLKP